MSNECFCSICEKYIRFNNKFSQHLISCNYAYEKKSLRFIFYNTYLKENEIEHLQQHVEDEKIENKILQLFMNDFRILKRIYNIWRRSWQVMIFKNTIKCTMEIRSSTKCLSKTISVMLYNLRDFVMFIARRYETWSVIFSCYWNAKVQWLINKNTRY